VVIRLREYIKFDWKIFRGNNLVKLLWRGVIHQGNQTIKAVVGIIYNLSEMGKKTN
jgi:hypothetical protein